MSRARQALHAAQAVVSAAPGAARNLAKQQVLELQLQTSAALNEGVLAAKKLADLSAAAINTGLDASTDVVNGSAQRSEPATYTY